MPALEELKKELEEWKSTAIKAGEKLQEQDSLLQKLLAPPNLYGTVLSRDNGTARVALDNRNTYNVKVLAEYVPDLQKGDTVYLNPESFCVIGKGKVSDTGTIAVVNAVHNGKIEISLGGEQKIIDSALSGLKPGDMVRLDPSYNLALEKTGSRHKDFFVENVQEVPWNKIGGLSYAIEALKEAVEYPYAHRELYRKYNKRPPKGVLLYGPPGCGKTLLAKAVAYNLANVSKKKSNDSNGNGHFLNINGPEILNEYVGVSERTVRNIFNLARENSAQNGYPTVVFFDEADALLQKRGAGISSDFNNTLVTQFLSELDGVDSRNDIMLILASNRPEMIDPAILRPGRIDRKVKINRPDDSAAVDIFKLYLSDLPLCAKDAAKIGKGKESAFYAQKAADELYRTDKRAFEIEYQNGRRLQGYFKDITSGAMIESIVQRTAQNAIKQELSGKSYGIRLDDLYKAIDDEYLESRDTLANCLTKDDIERMSMR